MYKETQPTIDQLELDPALWSFWPVDEPVRSDGDWTKVYRALGHVALDTSLPLINRGTIHQPYWRGNDRLSADDIRDLEGYLAFLRNHYGIPEGATIYPKRDAMPGAPSSAPAEPDPEDKSPEVEHAA